MRIGYSIDAIKLCAGAGADAVHINLHIDVPKQVLDIPADCKQIQIQADPSNTGIISIGRTAARCTAALCEEKAVAGQVTIRCPDDETWMISTVDGDDAIVSFWRA